MQLREYLLIVAGAFVPSMVLAWAAGFLVRRNAPKWGLVDRPTDGHKGHAKPTPLGGGMVIAWAVVLPFVVGSILLYRLHAGHGPLNNWDVKLPGFIMQHVDGLYMQLPKLYLVLCAGLALMTIGTVDDMRGVDWRFRLAAQVMVAFAVVWLTGWELTAFIPSPAVKLLLSVGWIVALVNAFNMLDNMDGLSAGVAALCGAALATMMIVSPDPQTGQPQLFIAGFCLVLIGALVGFLWHNRPPARLFMGDAGSYFIGFCLAIATMQATYTDYRGGRLHAVLAPLCIMAVPLYDLASVIAIRLWEGRSPFQPDRRHISHRLVDAGFSKTTAVAIIYVITAATGVAAMLLNWVNLIGAVVIFALVGCALAMAAIVERLAKRKL